MLLVANENASAAVVFSRSSETGSITAEMHTILNITNFIPTNYVNRHLANINLWLGIEFCPRSHDDDMKRLISPQNQNIYADSEQVTTLIVLTLRSKQMNESNSKDDSNPSWIVFGQKFEVLSTDSPSRACLSIWSGPHTM